jgi:hypothetical protein
MSARGQIDLVSPDLIEGWLHLPAATAQLDVYVGTACVGTCLADRPRADLLAAGYGACAFSFLVPLATEIGAPADVRLRLAGTPLWLLSGEGTRSEGFG